MEIYLINENGLRSQIFWAYSNCLLKGPFVGLPFNLNYCPFSSLTKIYPMFDILLNLEIFTVLDSVA